MKKAVTVVVLIIFLNVLHVLAQNGSNTGGNYRSNVYTFSCDTGVYADLVGSMNMTVGKIWDNPNLACPIGFTFKFFDIPFDTVWVHDTYEVGFGSDLGYDYPYYLIPYGADLMDRAFGDGTTKAKSPISYLLTGTAPKRILKIEWKNAAFLAEQDSFVTRTNYINVQLWLYETYNALEIHFGPHMLTYQSLIYQDSAGPYVGLIDNKNMKFFSLTGDSANPKLTGLPAVVVHGTPPNGIIYRFSTDYINSVGSKHHKDYSIFPNPVKDILNVDIPGIINWNKVSIFDLSGKVLLNSVVSNTNRISLNVSTLTAGTYLIKIQNAEKTVLQKFTKL